MVWISLYFTVGLLVDILYMQDRDELLSLIPEPVPEWLIRSFLIVFWLPIFLIVMIKGDK